MSLGARCTTLPTPSAGVWRCRPSLYNLCRRRDPLQFMPDFMPRQPWLGELPGVQGVERGTVEIGGQTHGADPSMGPSLPTGRMGRMGLTEAAPTRRRPPGTPVVVAGRRRTRAGRRLVPVAQPDALEACCLVLAVVLP